MTQRLRLSVAQVPSRVENKTGQEMQFNWNRNGHLRRQNNRLGRVTLLGTWWLRELSSGRPATPVVLLPGLC